MRSFIRIFLDSFLISIKTLAIILPSFLVYMVLTKPDILLHRGSPVIQTDKKDNIHELLPNTKWSSLRPCGEYFDEQAEFDRALQCLNEKVWVSNPQPIVSIPRCFVVTVGANDVYSDKARSLNFVPIITPLSVGAIVGVYEPKTRTVFVVENVDANHIYRHELQHFFLHLHDPHTGGGGHHQKLWEQCEAPFYEPSIKAKMISAISSLEQKSLK
jgi:hypothetical protein